MLTGVGTNRDDRLQQECRNEVVCKAHRKFRNTRTPVSICTLSIVTACICAFKYFSHRCYYKMCWVI